MELSAHLVRVIFLDSGEQASGRLVPHRLSSGGSGAAGHDSASSPPPPPCDDVRPACVLQQCITVRACRGDAAHMDRGEVAAGSGLSGGDGGSGEASVAPASGHGGGSSPPSIAVHVSLYVEPVEGFAWVSQSPPSRVPGEGSVVPSAGLPRESHGEAPADDAAAVQPSEAAQRGGGDARPDCGATALRDVSPPGGPADWRSGGQVAAGAPHRVTSRGLYVALCDALQGHDTVAIAAHVGFPAAVGAAVDLLSGGANSTWLSSHSSDAGRQGGGGAPDAPPRAPVTLLSMTCVDPLNHVAGRGGASPQGVARPATLRTPEQPLPSVTVGPGTPLCAPLVVLPQPSPLQAELQALRVRPRPCAAALLGGRAPATTAPPGGAPVRVAGCASHVDCVGCAGATHRVGTSGSGEGGATDAASCCTPFHAACVSACVQLGGSG